MCINYKIIPSKIYIKWKLKITVGFDNDFRKYFSFPKFLKDYLYLKKTFSLISFNIFRSIINLVCYMLLLFLFFFLHLTFVFQLFQLFF